MPEPKLVELMTLMRSVCEIPQKENQITIETLSARVEGLSADKRGLQTENANLKNDRDREVEIERQKLKEHKESVEEKNRKLDELLKQFEDQQEEQERQEKSADEAKLQAAQKMKSLSEKIDKLGAELSETYDLYTSRGKQSHFSQREVQERFEGPKRGTRNTTETAAGGSRQVEKLANRIDWILGVFAKRPGAPSKSERLGQAV